MLRAPPEGSLWLPTHSTLPNKQPTSRVRAHALTPAEPPAPRGARRGRAVVRACQRQKDSSRVHGAENPHARAPAPRSLGAGKPLPLGVEPESPRPHSGERHQNCARGFRILEFRIWFGTRIARAAGSLCHVTDEVHSRASISREAT